MTNQPRPVWPNRQARDRMMLAVTHLRDAGCYPETVAALERLVAAWDAAPADPTKAVETALTTGLPKLSGVVAAVLLALGCPHTEQA